MKGKVTGPSSSASANLWMRFWNIVLWIIIILVIVYVVLGIVFGVYYLQTRKALETYTMNTIKTLSKDAGETYDFTVDPRSVVHTNIQLSRDVMASLMQYYGNNFNTVMTVVKNYASAEDDHVALFGSPLSTPRPSSGKTLGRQEVEGKTLVAQDVPNVFSEAFQQDTTAFVNRTASSLPPDVLTKTQFYSRFFSMVIATITDPTKADAISKLWEWIHGQMD